MATKKPVRNFKLGRIQATVWQIDSEQGPFHSVSIVRRYNDDGAWKSTSSFSHQDLLVVAKLADMAHSYIYELEQRPATDEA